MNNTHEMTPFAPAAEACVPCQTVPFALSNGKETVLDHPTQEPPAQALLAKAADRPTQEPPAQSAQKNAVTAAWQTDKKITGLWRSCGNDRNSWMHVDTIGWRKFAENSDSAITAFSIIAAHAKTTGKGANYYEGDDGKITTLYVW